MKKNTTMLFVLLAFVCYSTQASGQDSLKFHPRNGVHSSQTNNQDSLISEPMNVVYGNFGNLLILYMTGSANYERRLFTTNTKLFSADYYVRACLGGYTGWDIGGAYGILSLQGVFFEKNNHLELGLGIGKNYDPIDYSNARYAAKLGSDPVPSRWEVAFWIPAGSVGYRYQKPTSGRVFRAGIGWPGAIYFSYGWAF